MTVNAEAATEEFLRQASPRLQGTASAQNAIARVKYSHDAMIDVLLANPGISQGELARHFGYTQGWLSRIMNSDAFLARMAQRKADLVDPTVVATIEEKFRAIASRSLDIVMEKLDMPTATFDQAMEAAELASKSLGYGARQQNVAVQQNFVVAMPNKVADASDWASKYKAPSPALQAMVEEVQTVQDAKVVKE